MQDLMGLRAKDFPIGTVIEVSTQRLRLRREHGKKPWRQRMTQLRFSHAEVDGSIEAGEVTVVTLGEGELAAA